MAERKRAAALDAALAAMFRHLEQRPVPDHVSATLRRLEPDARCDEAKPEAELSRA